MKVWGQTLQEFEMVFIMLGKSDLAKQGTFKPVLRGYLWDKEKVAL